VGAVPVQHHHGHQRLDHSLSLSLTLELLPPVIQACRTLERRPSMPDAHAESLLKAQHNSMRRRYLAGAPANLRTGS
jgi:hypothetical protein